MQAEKPPKGFGFSDTAFRIFILMASRRLKSDRFFTDDFRPEVYTQVGYDWVNETRDEGRAAAALPGARAGDRRRRAGLRAVAELGASEPGKKPRILRAADTVKAYLPWGD